MKRIIMKCSCGAEGQWEDERGTHLPKESLGSRTMATDYMIEALAHDWQKLHEKCRDRLVVHVAPVAP